MRLPHRAYERESRNSSGPRIPPTAGQSTARAQAQRVTRLRFSSVTLKQHVRIGRTTYFLDRAAARRQPDDPTRTWGPGIPVIPGSAPSEPLLNGVAGVEASAEIEEGVREIRAALVAHGQAANVIIRSNATSSAGGGSGQVAASCPRVLTPLARAANMPPDEPAAHRLVRQGRRKAPGCQRSLCASRSACSFSTAQPRVSS